MYQVAVGSGSELLGARALKLLGAARDLAAARDLGRVLAVVRRAARDLTGADGVTFVLREGAQVHYADEDAISPLWKGCRFPVEACISGWAMLHRETVVIEDVYLDDRIPHDVYRTTFVRSLVMVPVGEGEPVAAIGAYWARRRRATASEVELLEVLAGFAALALANDALVRELREALRARDEFISVAAHELRTPLCALGLTLESLSCTPGADGTRSADREEGQVARARRQVDRLGTLVNALLDVSRVVHDRHEVTRERMDLSTVTAAVVERVRARTAAVITFSCDGPIDGEWDPIRLEGVVENLLTNAVKFGEGAPVEVSVSCADGAACLVVADRGIGISEEDHGRIFEKFERAVSTRHFGGLGLGLWIARQNVEAHGGTIQVESRPGAGSRFTVRLPLALVARHAAESAPSAAGP